MEKGVTVAAEHKDHAAELHLCTCKSSQCAHCAYLHKALLAHDDDDDDDDCGSTDKLHKNTCDADLADDVSLLAPPSQSLILVEGAQPLQFPGAAQKLKLPCRRNWKSSFLAAPSSHEKLSKRSACLPLALHGPSDDSLAYEDTHSDRHRQAPYSPPHKQVHLSMVSLISSSFEQEQEITSSHPLFEHQISSFEKSMNSAPANANPRRICRYCNREFASGHALGGHMRVHGGLDAERMPSTIDTKLERIQFNASRRRSSSPLLNSTSEHQFTEVNCMVSVSSPLNSSNGDVIKRRINSEESLVRGLGEKKLSSSVGGHHGVSMPVNNVEKEQSLRRKEKIILGREKNQVVAIEEGKISDKLGDTSASQACFSEEESDRWKHICNEEDDDGNGDGGGDDDDDDVDDDRLSLFSSKLNMVMGASTNFIAKHSNFMNADSGCNADDRNLLQKLRPYPRSSRRRLWTDHDQGAISATSKKESSATHPQLSLGGQQSSSPPSLQPPHAAPEPACSCSECGKVFWSWKALFGHMRCHPEREWRGIQRPDVSSSELGKLGRATRRLSSLSVAAATAGVEKRTELESDAEKREAVCNIDSLAKRSTIAAHHRAELIKSSSQDIKEEGCLIMSTTRMLKGKNSQVSAVDDNLTPAAWPTRKRSRWNRATISATVKVMSSVTFAEPALTSETITSSDLRENDKVSARALEDLDMANCLVLLSSAGNELQGRAAKRPFGSTEESTYKRHALLDPYCNAVSSDGDDDDIDGGDDNEAEDDDEVQVTSKSSAGIGVKYECSTCKRCFKSHQALGGHRASHRKTKGCFALMNQSAEESVQEGKEDNNVESDDFASSELKQWQAMGHGVSSLQRQRDERKAQAFLTLSPSRTDHQLPIAVSSKKKKFKGHPCSICHRIFPSGQALGGHKRCHWTGEKIPESGSMASSSNNKGFLQEQHREWVGSGDHACPPNFHRMQQRSKEDCIDLNLPAPLEEDDDEARYDNARLSSTEVTEMEPDVQDGVEDAGLDVEEVSEGHLVDYIGGKKRSVNRLFINEWDADGARGRHEGARATGGSSEAVGEDRGTKRRSDKRASVGGPMWDLQWTPSLPNAQVCAMQPL